MQLVEKHIVNRNSEFYSECDLLCFKSKNLYNYANYVVRQEFINTSKEKELGLREDANWIQYFALNRMLIDSKQFDMYQLPIKVSNQTLMLLDKNWKSFFRSIKDYVKNPSKYTGKPSLPKYLDKTKGRFVVVYEKGAISTKWLKQNIISLSGTSIKIPFINNKNEVRCARIVPKGNHYVIEIVYEQPEKPLKENNDRYCSIDLGLSNLATVASNVIKPIIINGKPLKSINQYYNKKLSKYKSVLETRNKAKTSKRISKLTDKRNKKIEDYLHKASRYIINHLVSNEINTLVIGNNKEWKQEINIGKVNNQNFVSIPHSKFIQMLQYKAALEGITVIVREESYTSKNSFLDKEPVCKHDVYVGKRIKRGLFRTSTGKLINADLNGGLNILIKAVPNIWELISDNGIEVIAVSPRVISL